MKKRLPAVFVLVFTFALSTSAQEGGYIQPYYLLQYTQIANQNDYLRHQSLNYETTYKNAFGISYVHNFTNIFGIETGIKYAHQGQKYSGFIDSNYNDYSQKKIDYKSEVDLEYIMVPIVFNFNSVLEDDKVYLTIGAGFQLDFLQSVDAKIDPAPVEMPESNIDLINFYNQFNFSFVSNAYFNYNFFRNWSLVFGFQMYRTLGNIEGYSYDFNQELHPAEYSFPISVKKVALNDLSVREEKYPSKNISYSMLVGLNYKISKN